MLKNSKKSHFTYFNRGDFPTKFPTLNLYSTHRITLSNNSFSGVLTRMHQTVQEICDFCSSNCSLVRSILLVLNRLHTGLKLHISTSFESFILVLQTFKVFRSNIKKFKFGTFFNKKQFKETFGNQHQLCQKIISSSLLIMNIRYDLDIFIWCSDTLRGLATFVWNFAVN